MSPIEWAVIGMAVVSAGTQVMAGNADADAAAAASKRVEKNAEQQELKRRTAAQIAHSQVAVGGAAGSLDAASPSLIRQHETIEKRSDIEQYADDFNTRFRRGYLSKSGANRQAQGYIGGMLTLAKGGTSAWWMHNNPGEGPN